MAKLSIDEFNQFNSELASLVRAGIPLPSGLREIASNMRSARLRRFTSDIASGLEKGMSITESAEQSSVSVSPEYLALLRCADQSGDTKSFLDFSVHHSRRIQKHRLTLAASLGYPLFVLIIAFGILIFLSHVLLPRFSDIFAQLGAELPSLTMLTHDLMRLLDGPIALILFFASLILLPVMIFVDSWRDRFIDFLSVMPGFSRLLAISDTSVAMRFVGVMLGKGIPLTDALAAASLAVSSKASAKALRTMRESAEKGNRVAAYLPSSMPPTAVYLFRTAEKTGDLPEACIGISEYCENQFEILSRRSLTFFEPLLIALVGIVIATIVVGNYLPLFSIPKVVR